MEKIDLLNLRLLLPHGRRGELAQRCGKSITHVTNVLHGRVHNDAVLKEAQTIISEEIERIKKYNNELKEKKDAYSRAIADRALYTSCNTAPSSEDK